MPLKAFLIFGFLTDAVRGSKYVALIGGLVNNELERRNCCPFQGFILPILSRGPVQV
jgi:hypothetical protein